MKKVSGRNRNKTTEPTIKEIKANSKQLIKAEPPPKQLTLIPGLYEKALPFTDPELQLHRKLQSSDQ